MARKRYDAVDGASIETERDGQSDDDVDLESLVADDHCRATLNYLRGIVDWVPVERLVWKVADRPHESPAALAEAVRTECLPRLESAGLVARDGEREQVRYRHDNPLDDEVAALFERTDAELAASED